MLRHRVPRNDNRGDHPRVVTVFLAMTTVGIIPRLSRRSFNDNPQEPRGCHREAPRQRDVAISWRTRRPAYTSFWFFIGRFLTGFPVAAKIAFITAGAMTQIVGSPTPPQKSWVGASTLSTFGMSASFNTG
ncbi:MAG: hypothetical protein JWM26_4203 [Betaproteobacteria bacterium]|nr:hypothetical protein [Betaproteobacteria bacterium]